MARLWGTHMGLQGLAHDDWVELTELAPDAVAILRTQPGAALGSGRYRLANEEIGPALDLLYSHQIGALFLIGGNGAMAAAHKLAQAAECARYAVGGKPLCVIGVPKTIDNDLVDTDCTPGYGSAARFVAQSVHDMGLDLRAMRNFDDVALIEVMGRHVGWLTAATALARRAPDDAPHLILLPEVLLDEERFLAEVQRIHARQDVCFVAVAEGIRDTAGRFLAEKLNPASYDASGQKMLAHAAGLLPYMAQLIQRALGLRCRQIRPDLVQRSSSALASDVDRELAALVGTQAVNAALAGTSDLMITLKRAKSSWVTESVPLANVIGRERALPEKFIHGKRFDVTTAFHEYAGPLVGDLNLHSIRL